MTLSLGLVTRAAPEADLATSQLILMADSRLSFARNQHLDSYIKAVTLGSRSAAVGAGTSTPFALAAEAMTCLLSVDQQFRGTCPLAG